MKPIISNHPHSEDLASIIHRLDALITIAMEVDLTTQEPSTVYHYLWTMSDFTEMAKQICDNTPL